VAKKWVWSKIFDDLKFWVKIILRIQPWYFRRQATSRSGDIQVTVRGQNVDVAQNFRQGQILSQNLTANPTVLYSSTAAFRFRRLGGYPIGAWPKICDEVIFWIRILKRIQLWYFHHHATTVRGQKVGVVNIFEDIIFWSRILVRIQLLYFHHQVSSGSNEFYCESNGVIFVNSRLSVPEIGRLSNRSVAENFRWS
jgi:hypothetical protein